MNLDSLGFWFLVFDVLGAYSKCGSNLQLSFLRRFNLEESGKICFD